MNPTINRLKIVFLVLFAIGTVGIWSYQIFYVWPAHRCDERGGWWDRKTRVCAAPIYIPDLTGRPKGMSRKDWSERQAARQIQRDQEGYPTGNATPTPTTAPAAPPAQTAPAAPARKP